MIAYFAILATLAGLSVLMTAKDAASTVLFATLGFGFPLVYAATGLIYWLALLPLALLRQRNLGLGVGLSLLTALAVATAPGLVAERRLRAAAVPLLAKDHAPVAPIRVQTVEVWTDGGDEDLSSRTRPCGEQCVSLLLSGRLSWIRVIPSEGADLPAKSAVFKRVPHHCLPGEGRAALDASACVEGVRGMAVPADVTIEVRSEPALTSHGGAAGLGAARRADTLLVRLRDGSEVLRAGRLTARIPTMPTLIRPAFRGINSGGLEFASTSFSVGPASLDAVLDMLASPPGTPPRR